MTATHLTQSVTWREGAYYFFGATLALMCLALAGVIFWFVLPAPQIFDLGEIDDFPLNAPQYQGVTGSNGNTISLVIVRLPDKVVAFNRYAGPCHYKYVWVPTNNRFEDPCSGYKWTITGMLLLYSPKPSSAWTPHDIDQYAVSIRQGHLFINLDQKLPGQLRTEQPVEVVCPAGQLFSCQLRETP